jgi:hypothetical protein
VTERLMTLASRIFPARKAAEVYAYYAAEGTKWIPVVRQAVGCT